MRKYIVIIFLFFMIMSSPLFAANQVNKEEALNLFSSQKKIVNFDFKKIPVKELLQFMAQSMHFNIIMSESVSGKLSLHFNNITWQQAFDVVLEMSGLVKKQIDNVLLIATPAEFVARQKNMTETAPFKTIKIKLHHVDVSQVMASLKNQLEILSSGAHVSADPIDNSLWIKEDIHNIAFIKQYIQQIDLPEKQILIVSKVVNIDDSKINELGIKLNSVAKHKAAEDLQVSLPEEESSHRFNLAIISVNQNQLLNLELDALELMGQSKIIADPKIITQNHKTAIIEAGEEIPYQEKTSSGATSASFKKAVLSLKVTPTILPDQRIILDLEINQNKVAPLSINGAPAIQTQELKTQVIVHDSETLILGGIFETTNSEVVDKLPLLGSIPLFKHVFNHTKKQQIRKELLIFVTPRILSENHPFADFTPSFSRREKEGVK